jgi:hypothetical protein
MSWNGFSLFLSVKFRPLIFLVLLLALGSHFSAQGQILNDSAQSVYGPSSTAFTYPKNIRLNLPEYYQADTTLNFLHRFQRLQQLNNFYQDLGVHGTAMNPIFYQMPKTVGITSGYHAYDPYFRDASTFKLYDTKSPYTHLAPVFGGAGRNVMDIEYGRNITEFWSVGFDFTTIRMDKQLSARGRGDRVVVNNSYDLYTHYSDSARKYQVIVGFSRMSNEVSESGGIVPPEVNPESELFDYRDARVWLAAANSAELRQQVFIYQEYMLKPYFGAFAQLSRQNQVNSFTDNTSGNTEGQAYYPEYLINPSSTNDRNKLSQNEIEAGIKGERSGLFYNIFYKNRNLIFQPGNLPQRSFMEHYLATYLRWNWEDRVRLDVEAESNQFGNYRVNGKLFLLGLEGEVTRTNSAPNMMQRQYWGNHYFWENSFNNVLSDNLKGQYTYMYKSLIIKPKASFTRISNYIYFNEEKRPEQASGDITILSPGLELNTSFNQRIFLVADAYYTLLGGASKDKIRIPTYFANARLYFANAIFGGKMEIQSGFDMNYKSAYYGMGYDPITQQFHLQNNFKIPGYVWADFYTNIKVSRIRIFAKVTHINQGIIDEGYFITPYYTGQKRIFDLGISWMFFD